MLAGVRVSCARGLKMTKALRFGGAGSSLRSVAGSSTAPKLHRERFVTLLPAQHGAQCGGMERMENGAQVAPRCAVRRLRRRSAGAQERRAQRRRDGCGRAEKLGRPPWIACECFPPRLGSSCFRTTAARRSSTRRRERCSTCRVSLPLSSLVVRPRLLAIVSSALHLDATRTSRPPARLA
jgi:hypothetical protein